jgi:hypothetical protein
MNIFSAGRLECNTAYTVVVTPCKVRFISFPKKIFSLRFRFSNAISPFYDPRNLDITTFIRHDLGLNRPASTSSNSFFWVLSSRLHHLAYNTALVLAPFCSFLCHVVDILICIIYFIIIWVLWFWFINKWQHNYLLHILERKKDRGKAEYWKMETTCYFFLLYSSYKKRVRKKGKIIWFITSYFVVEITNTMHWFAPLLYSMRWLLHVSAVVCHHQGAELHENANRFGGLSKIYNR